MKTSKIKCFFSRPWWLKLVFRWGETPISTLESCACHRKMIMTLKCPFTKSHKYHVSSFWRENLKIKIGNPSQGAVSTAYLVFALWSSCEEFPSRHWLCGLTRKRQKLRMTGCGDLNSNSLQTTRGMKGGKDSRNITETILFLWRIALRSRDALKCLSGFFTENTVHTRRWGLMGIHQNRGIRRW